MGSCGGEVRTELGWKENNSQHPYLLHVFDDNSYCEGQKIGNHTMQILMREILRRRESTILWLRMRSKGQFIMED